MTEKEKDSLIKAIEQSRGFVTVVSQLIGKALSTTKLWIKQCPEAQEALAQARDHTKDFAESKLFKLMESKNERISLHAVMYYLNNQARNRGYGWQPKENITQDTETQPVSKLSDAELNETIMRSMDVLGYDVNKRENADTAKSD